MKRLVFLVIVFGALAAAGAGRGMAQADDGSVLQVEILAERTDILVDDAGARSPIYSAASGVIPDDLIAPAADGRALAFVEVVDPINFITRLMAIQLPARQVTALVLPDETGMPTNPLWSPDGEKLAYIWVSAAPPGLELRVLDLTTQQTARILGADAFSVEVVYGKSHALAWEASSEALQFVHQHDRRAYRVALNGARDAVPEGSLAPDIARYLEVMRLTAEAADYEGMTKPVSVRDYNGTCGNGYSALYPDYGGCVYTGPHPGVDMYAGATNIGCGTPVVAVCTGPIIRVERYAVSGDGCANSNGGGYKNLGWQIVLRCDVPPANLGGVTYGGGMAYAVYAHLRYIEPDLAWGVWVPKGRVLGQVGSTGYSPTGAHLHFQMEKDVTGLDASHPVYPTSYDAIAAQTWNPMYFIQAHIAQPPAGAPAPISPTSGSSTCDTTPTFTWAGVGDATGYRIEVDNSSAFGSPEIARTTSTTSYTASAGLAPGAYFWRVQATNAYGSGPWSSTGVLAILAAPAAPILSAPAAQSTTCDATPSFTWEKVAEATSYRLQVDDNADFSSPAINLTTSGIPYTPGIDLAPGVYYWRVQAANACSTSAWSSTRTVTILTFPAAPKLSAPANGSRTCDATPTFRWTSVHSADSYRIHVDNDANFSSPMINQATSGTSYTAAMRAAPGQYYWRVRASNVCGISAWVPAYKLLVTPCDRRAFLPLVDKPR